MLAWELRLPIAKPAIAIMVPDVTIVGKAKFRASMIDSFGPFVFLSSMKRLLMTIA